MNVPTAVCLWVSCVLLEGAIFTPLAKTRGVYSIAALLLLLSSSSLATLLLQLISSSFLDAFFSLPAFCSGLCLAVAALLLLLSVQLFGLSSLLLASLFASLMSTCLSFIYSRISVLGHEYNADASLHLSAFVLSILVGGCGVGCLLIVIASRLSAQLTASGCGLNGAQEDERDEDVFPNSDRQIEEKTPEMPNDEHTVNQDPLHRVPSSFSSTVSWYHNSYCCLRISVQSILSSPRLSKPSVHLAAGFACSLLSALLYNIHLVPIYATQRNGILRMLPLEPYLLSLHLGLLLVLFTIYPLFILLLSHPSQGSVLLSPCLSLVCFVCGSLCGFIYWLLLSYMPGHSSVSSESISADFGWYYYSAGSDALAVASLSIPRLTLTVLALAFSDEIRKPLYGRAVAKGREMQRTDCEAQRLLAQDEGAVLRQGKNVSPISWSTMSLWCFALVLGSVSDGVVSFAWDVGY